MLSLRLSTAEYFMKSAILQPRVHNYSKMGQSGSVSVSCKDNINSEVTLTSIQYSL